MLILNILGKNVNVKIDGPAKNQKLNASTLNVVLKHAQSNILYTDGSAETFCEFIKINQVNR